MFCPQTFDSAAKKDDHVLEHFGQETCMECHQNLIRIGSNLYTLHNDTTCVSFKNQPIICKSQSFSDLDEKNESNSSFIESNEQIYNDIDTSEINEIKLEPIDVEFPSNESKKEYDYDNECDRIEHRDYDSDSSIDEEAYDKIVSNLQKKYLNKHMSKLECPVCLKKISKLEHIRKHMKMKHSPRQKFKCAHCKTVYLAKVSVEKHLPQCKRRKQLKFKEEILEKEIIEIKSTMDQETYDKYLSRLPGEDIDNFECPICIKKFAKLDLLLKHMKLRHDPRNKNIKCAHCKIVYLKQTSLDKHLSMCKRKKRDEEASILNSGQEMAEKQQDAPPEFLSKEMEIAMKVYNGFLSQLPEDKHIGRFKCPICKNVFSKKEFLLRHMKMQHDPTCQKFKCPYCKNVYLAKLSLENHIPRCIKHTTDHQTDQLVDNTATGTPIDLKTYQEIYSRLLNDNSQTENVKYECPMCKRKFSKVGNVRSHMKLKHDPSCKKFKCVYCNIIYINEYSLERHLAQCKYKNDYLPKFINQFECPICQKKLAKMTILRAHIKMQHDPSRKKLKCNQCKRTFRSESSVEDHISRCIKRNSNTEVDSICSISPKVEIDRNATENQNKLLICYICVKIFQCENDLIKHKEICKPKHKKNSFVEKFECFICRTEVKTKQAMKRHLDCMHNPDTQKKIECKLCKKIVHVSYLRKHQQIVHMNYRQFLCTLCGHNSATKFGYKVHMWHHTGEKPYACLYEGCKKRFTTTGIRTEHMRSHSGEKPLHCKIDGCNQRFRFASDFRKHKVKKHGVP